MEIIFGQRNKTLLSMKTRIIWKVEGVFCINFYLYL